MALPPTARARGQQRGRPGGVLPLLTDLYCPATKAVFVGWLGGF
jgi:hypothetical protein